MMKEPMTFDRMLPALANVFDRRRSRMEQLGNVLVNRDLNGRVRIIVNEELEYNADAQETLKAVARDIEVELGPHAYPPDRAVLFEPQFQDSFQRETKFQLESFPNICVVDRLVTEGNWARIATFSGGAPRIAFYSIKGGVGRSTALAAAAAALAQHGKRVLVLDLDLESPGLSSSLLPEDRRPAYGITDWLVEDLVDNGEAVFGNLVALSDLSPAGDIRVVPAHGADPGEYVSKLGRVWMPKVGDNGAAQPWFVRLSRLVDELETSVSPDVVLIDARAGIDETASAIVTDLGVSLILLFAVNGDQTWNGYRTLFRHWRKTEAVRDIRERLQVVAALIPEEGSEEYRKSMNENAWSLFLEEIYDQLPAIPAGGLEPEEGNEPWSFGLADETAPHYPWRIYRHRGFAELKDLHSSVNWEDRQLITAVFGGLIGGLSNRVMPREGA
ncbi:MAG: AAA family ATPase [Pseudomonadota bacterium]